MTAFKHRLRDLLIPQEPPLPASILGERARRFSALPSGATVCIKVSAAHILPYPFCVSQGFLAQVVAEIHAANPMLEIILTEGGVGESAMREVAAANGLNAIPHARFVDAEESEPVFVENPMQTPYQVDGFWLPEHWVNAGARVLLTTAKLRSHHFRRWYSGGTRNLIGLLPRAHYRLASSRRNMRSVMHKQGMDAMAADLYATTGRDLLTILDGRFVARQDEHFPLRFVRKASAVIVAEDPRLADEEMTRCLRLPFRPPYLALIAEADLSLAKAKLV